MKKKKWIYSIFSIVVLLSLVIFLVVMQLRQEKTEKNETQEMYATAFTVNVPEEITMLVGTNINLLSGYISVTPAEMISKVEVGITPANANNSNGLVLSNNVLTANEVGEYSIKFTVPRSQMKKFSKTIKVIVHENTSNSHIHQTKQEISVNTSTNIFDMFEFKDTSCEYEVSTSSNLILNENYLTAQNVGDETVSFSFTDGYVKYNYNFTIGIKEQSRYQILVQGVENNTLNLTNGSSVYVNYEIIDREEGSVSQVITATSNNENIVVVDSIIKPLIKITAISAGEAVITITFSLDTSVTLNINVIVT